MPALRTSVAGAGAGAGGGGGPKHRCEHAGCSYATDNKSHLNWHVVLKHDLDLPSSELELVVTRRAQS